MSNSKTTNQSFFNTQMVQYYNYLKKHIATNSMVSEALNIPQKNLTRYKRFFEKENKLFEVGKGICRKTKFRASYLTTNKNLIPKK